MAITNEGGIFAIINGIIEGLPEAAGKIGNGVANMGSLMPDVNFAALGRSLTTSLTPGSRELSQNLVHSPEIAPASITSQAALGGKCDVSPAALFTEISAPVFSTAPLATNERVF